MSTWFMKQRQDFIRAQLETFGQIRRVDIMNKFAVSTPQASKDISDFMAAHPDAISYDKRAKMYTLDHEHITQEKSS